MQVYSKEQTILQDLSMKINITENKFGLNIDKLFSLGARKNPKRSFLFVSKVLGKHIPVNPIIPLKIGYLLGSEISTEPIPKVLIDDLVYSINEERENTFNLNELEKFKFNIDKKTLFIGFAETATALGHSVFSSFNSTNSMFVHTTREEVKEIKSSINFEEEHSHATSHFCYLLNKFDFERVVLIDDEMTTGKTNLNLIKSFLKNFNVKEFVCMSILDWRNEEYIKKYVDLENELNISIKVVSLIKGNIECNNKNIDIDLEELEYGDLTNVEFDFSKVSLFPMSNYYINYTVSNRDKEEKFLLGTGKFGVSSLDNPTLLEYICYDFEKLNSIFDIISNEKTLFMGFGEFMYIPMYVAAYLNNKNIEYSSPSLSPIHTSDLPNYPIKNVDKINCPYGIQKDYHIYNLSEEYKNVILFLERQPSKEFLEKFKRICVYRNINKLTIVIGS